MTEARGSNVISNLSEDIIDLIAAFLSGKIPFQKAFSKDNPGLQEFTRAIKTHFAEDIEAGTKTFSDITDTLKLGITDDQRRAEEQKTSSIMNNVKEDIPQEVIRESIETAAMEENVKKTKIEYGLAEDVATSSSAIDRTEPNREQQQTAITMYNNDEATSTNPLRSARPSASRENIDTPVETKPKASPSSVTSTDATESLGTKKNNIVKPAQIKVVFQSPEESEKSPSNPLTSLNLGRGQIPNDMIGFGQIPNDIAEEELVDVVAIRRDEPENLKRGPKKKTCCVMM